MNLKEIYSVSTENLETDGQIVNVTLSKPNELVFMDMKGEVFSYNFDTKEQNYLFSPTTNTNFDPEKSSSIYTIDEIVVIVNNYKTDGSVHYPNKYKFLTLYREDYHADISKFPISLFKDKHGVPHLIYAQTWNHIQIVNLDTRQILTASKSLIEIGAEEKRIEFYKKHEEANKLMWPRPYDYFFGELQLSPDQKYFLSAGWSWGSSDDYKAFNIEDFIKSNRISDIPITAGEHETRATCWIDNRTIAVCFHPWTEGEDSNKNLYEIQLYQMNNEKFTLTKRINVVDVDIVHARMFYHQKNDVFIFIKDETIYVISKNGELLYANENLNIKEYNKGYFLNNNGNFISVLELH